MSKSHPEAGTTLRKRPFSINRVLQRIRVAVRPFAKAALFELFDDGFDTPFEILVACSSNRKDGLLS
ncbi:MAG: hypothetical protein ACJ8FY_27480 [Gemmataceae bacterium]